MPYLQTARTQLYYDIFEPDITMEPSDLSAAGTVPTLLLIHGFLGTPLDDFAEQLPALRARYRILAPELHGYGRSTHRQHYSLSYYREDVADLLALLDALDLPDVLVLGFSDGGIVGLLLAALHPQRVHALAVLGAQPTISAADALAIRHWLLEVPLSTNWTTRLDELHGAPYWHSLPARYVAIQEDLVAAGGVLISPMELAAIRCPTLIMHGLRDRVVPATYATTLQAHISGSQLQLFPAGHAVHLRCPESYLQTVLDFFQNHSRL